jgi:predicted transcriptional regulator
VDQSLLSLTADVVSNYVSNNRTPTDGVPALIEAVYRSFGSAGSTLAAESAKVEPAVAVKKSVFPDHIVCLACGKGFSMLKRHLRTEHQLAPDEYRARYELPRDYPLVAPDYAKTRSKLAKKLGLGRDGNPRRAGGAPGQKRHA